MAILKTPGGGATVDDETISRVIAPYGDNAYTSVYGPSGRASLPVLENPEHLVARLILGYPLAKFSSPANISVWLKGSAVTLVRAPLPLEKRPEPMITGSIAIVGGQPQPLREPPAIAIARLNDVGGKLSPTPVFVPYSTRPTEVEAPDRFESPDYVEPHDFAPWQ